MAAFVLLTLYLVALPSKFPALTHEPEGWSVTTSVVLAKIAASGAGILALLLIARLWEQASARWLCVFLALTAFAWGLASSPSFSGNVGWGAIAERVRMPLANASLALAATGLVLFAIHFPVRLKPEDFRYWRLRAEKATPGGRFGNFLGLSSSRTEPVPLPGEFLARMKRLAYLDRLYGMRADGVDTFESMAVRPNQALLLGLGATAFVFFVILFSEARNFASDFSLVFFLLISWALFYLRVSYTAHLGVDRQKLLWVVEGLTLSFVIPFALTNLSGVVFFLLGLVTKRPVSGLSGVILIGWASGWIALIACLAIAIFKEGVFDPKLVIKKTILYSGITGIVVLLYFGLAGGVGAVLIQWVGVTNQSVTIVSTLAVAAVFMPVRTRVQGFVERRFFRKDKEYPLLLDSIRKESTAGVDWKSMLERIGQHVHKALGSSDIVIFSKSQQNQAFTAAAQIEVKENPESAPVYFLTSSIAVQNFSETRSYADLKLPEDEKDRLQRIRSVLLVPARFGGELLGFLSIGGNKSGKGYDTQDIEFLETAAGHVAIGINNCILKGEQRDLEQARQIQQHLLPVDIPQMAGYDISGASEPARHVGGDYFDVLKLSDSKLLVCIADVAGKGMPAALLMSNIQATVKTLATAIISPKQLCERANRIISNNTSSDKFITFFAGVLDSTNSRFTYVNAGHNPPIVFRPNGSEQLLSAGGAVLGVFEDGSYEQAEVSLSIGDRILLYTDGVTEVMSPTGEEFGEGRLIDLVKNTATTRAAELQAAIMTNVSQFCRGNFLDDVTIVAIQVK